MLCYVMLLCARIVNYESTSGRRNTRNKQNEIKYCYESKKTKLYDYSYSPCGKVLNDHISDCDLTSIDCCLPFDSYTYISDVFLILA